MESGESSTHWQLATERRCDVLHVICLYGLYNETTQQVTLAMAVSFGIQGTVDEARVGNTKNSNDNRILGCYDRN